MDRNCIRQTVHKIHGNVFQRRHKRNRNIYLFHFQSLGITYPILSLIQKSTKNREKASYQNHVMHQ